MHDSTVLSHAMEIDWSHDENGLVYLGPMMVIDRVQFHQVIGIDWTQSQSKVEFKLISLN